jgi:tRNA(fMet)-specific endonuclease VapC
MHLLDADTITFLYEGNVRVSERLRRCDDPIIGVAIVTKAEVLRGRIEFLLKAADGEQVLRAQNALLRTESLLNKLPAIAFNAHALAEFERLKAVKRLRKTGQVDLLVASVALAYDATLVTRNVRHFRQVPGLKIENWVD